MASLGLCKVKPPFSSLLDSGINSQATRAIPNILQRWCKVEDLPATDSSEWDGRSLLAAELRKKILSFRDILDLPPCNESAPINKILIGTVEDLHKLYPKFVSTPLSPTVDAPAFKGLCHFNEALKSVEVSWAETYKCYHKFSKERDANNMESTTLEQLGERVLARLHHLSMGSKEIFDMMVGQEEITEITKISLDRLQDNSTFGEFLVSDNRATHIDSPVTPTSVIPETIQSPSNIGEFSNIAYSPPFLIPLRLQSRAKLKPIDVKRLSFHMFSHVPVPDSNLMQQNQIKMEALEKDSNSGNNKTVRNVYQALPVTLKTYMETSLTGGEEAGPPKTSLEYISQDIISEKVSGYNGVIPSKPSELSQHPPLTIPQSKGPLVAPPPPLLFCVSKDPKVFAPPSPPPPPLLLTQGRMPPLQVLQKGSATAPPPPPLDLTKSLRPKKANTKLKRSTQMGSLYRLLKGKVEGSSLNGKSSQEKKNSAGGSAGAGTKGQGMAEALAELTKRSPYFQQIENDIQKHAKTIMELKSAIHSLKTVDMEELLKFHKHVELHLDTLTDETKVLARFDGFPSGKLETIRTAAALYSRLDTIATNLENWKVVGPLAHQLEKVERYFYKIKVEVDAIERNKEEESKRFQNDKINFDFNILLRIKEHMVDVSSSCIEIALQENKVFKGADEEERGIKLNDQIWACFQLLWRVFELAFRVYTFAGGQDERADRLTHELAQKINAIPFQE